MLKSPKALVRKDDTEAEEPLRTFLITTWKQNLEVAKQHSTYLVYTRLVHCNLGLTTLKAAIGGSRNSKAFSEPLHAME